MIKKFKNYEVELSGSMVYIRDNDGMLIKARNVNPNNAVEDYNTICKAVQKKDLVV